MRRSVLPASLVLASTAIAFAVACGDATRGEGPGGSEGPGEGQGAGSDGGPGDADAGQGGSDAGDDAALTLTIFARMGDPTDDTTPPLGPGLVLMGGTDLDAAFMWGRERLGPLATRAFDAVVLEAGGDDGYAPYLYDVAPFRSVQVIAIPPEAGPRDLAAAADVVSRAELVYFPGGEQNAYVAWNGSPLMKAVQGVYDRGGVVAGTSAGALILGAFVFDAVAAGVSENVTPEVALADPFDPKISFTRGMLRFPPLADAITEVHFEQRDRMGRLAMFLARQHTDGAIQRKPPAVLGIAIDEGAAIVVDGAGTGSFLQDSPDARAFLVRGGPPGTAQPGQRLAYPSLEVHRFDDPSQTFDFTKWCGTAPVYTIDVFADENAPFGPSSPYDRPATSSPCPSN